MKRLRFKRLLSLAVTLLLVFQTMPLGTPVAAGETGRNLLAAETSWAKIHDESGTAVPDWASPSTSKSFIKVTDKNGNEIPRADDNAYTDIPAGAKIELRLGFHFEVPQGEENVLAANDWFAIDLPAGLNFSGTGLGPISGKISAGAQEYADWRIENGKLVVTLTSGVEALVDEIWGALTVKGEFQYLEDAGAGADMTAIQFGGQTITIARRSAETDTKPPAQSGLAKSCTYDPSTNEITWTVKMTPPGGASDVNYDYSGFTLIDKISGNHTYKEGTFKVNGAIETPTLSDANKTITYTFPKAEASKGVQTITYATTPTFTAGASAKSTFTNVASLKLLNFSAAPDATATYETTGFFSKVGGNAVLGADGQSAYIQWAVTVKLPQTPNGVFAYPNAKIIDTLQTANHIFFVDGTHPVEVTFAGGSKQTVADTDSGAGSYAVVGNILTYSFPSGQPVTSQTAAQTYTLTYYTKVENWNGSVDTNSDVKVKNQAAFTWEHKDGSGSGTWTTPGVNVEKTIVPANGLIGKATTAAANFDHSAAIPSIQGDYILWTVVVNRNKIPMSGVSVVDEVQAGHDLVIDDIHPLAVKKNSEAALNYTGSELAQVNGTLSGITGTGFTFTLPAGPWSDTYTLTFYTKLNQTGLNGMYKNGTSTFVNRATLKGHGSDIMVSSTKTYNLEMLNKSLAAGYHFTTRTVQWKLTVNRNKLPMANGIVTDYLPDYMSLTPSGAAAFSVKVNGGAAQSLDQAGIAFAEVTTPKKGFTLALPDGTTDTYEITYSTYLADEALETSGLKSFTNESKLQVGSFPVITENETTSMTNTVIKKQHNYTGGTQDVVVWTVEINPAQVDLKTPVVRDVLQDALQLVDGSVKLYIASVAADGKLTQTGNSILNAGDVRTGIVDAGADQGKSFFEVVLPAGKHAYVLVFETLIMKDNTTISNTIGLSGSSTSATGSGTATGISVGSLYSDGGSGSYSLTVKKVDEQGNPLAGVGFALCTPDGKNYKDKLTKAEKTGVTDSNGEIKFENLPNWVFYVKEDASTTPTGRLFVSGLTGGIRPGENKPIVVTNQLGMATVQITKVGANDIPLSGGKFTLTGTSAYNGQQVTIADVSAVNGTVTFDNVPIGSYTVTETEAPAGHQLKLGTAIAVVVGYNGDKTGTVVTYNGSATGKFVNEPTAADATRVSLKKTDLAGVSLSGGSFLLSGTDHKGNAVSKTVSAATDGTVSFDGVTIGTYTIREITPPGGYLRPASDTILRVAVAYNALHTGLDVAITGDGGNAAAYDGLEKTFKNAPAVTDVTFNKVHSTRADLKIDGGIFELRGMADTGKEFVVTAKAQDGKVTFEKVPVNADSQMYTIKELSAPGGYLTTKETLTVTVSYTDGSKTAVAAPVFSGKNGDTLKNEPAPMIEAKAKISVLKTDEKGNKLAGAVFTVSYRNGTEVLQTVTTGSDGIALFEDLALFKEYTVREASAPKGYKLSDTEINLNPQKENEVYAFTVVNHKIDEKGSVSVLKTDEKGNKLAGATFTLFDKDGAAVASTVSDADGMAKFADIPANAAYTIRETAAPKGYVRSTQTLTFTLEKDAVLSFTMVNQTIYEKGSVSVLKTDEQGNQLAGATFTLYNKDGAAVASAVSDVDGIAKFADIPSNAAYTIRETAAPKGYERSAQILSFTLEKDAALSFTVVNRKLSENVTKTYGSLTLMKVGPGNVRLADAEFTLYDDTGKRIMSTVTGEDGIAKFTNLPLGSYSVRETRAPAGYQLSDEELTIVIAAERLNKKFTLRNTKIGEEPEVAGWEEIIVDIEDGELPYTGSTFGDQFFLLAGVSLLAIGFVTLIPRRKGGKHLADPAKE